MGQTEASAPAATLTSMSQQICAETNIKPVEDPKPKLHVTGNTVKGKSIWARFKTRCKRCMGSGKVKRRFRKSKLTKCKHCAGNGVCNGKKSGCPEGECTWATSKIWGKVGKKFAKWGAKLKSLGKRKKVNKSSAPGLELQQKNKQAPSVDLFKCASA